MATSTNIVEFPSRGSGFPVYSDAAISSGQKKPAEPATTASFLDVQDPIFSEAGSSGSQNLRLSQNELYPARHAFSPEHITALRLLTLAVGRSKRALDAFAADDALIADTEIQKLQVLLPELFCCRALGDGFGTIINSFMSAFEALAGDTPDVGQIRAINRVLQLLKEKPFLSADEADDQVEVLENVGLSPYPRELVEFLSSSD